MILACVDRSAYRDSVCDHAAWLASRMDAPIEVLHARRDDDPQPLTRDRRLVQHAQLRLREHGAGDVHGAVRTGDLVELAAQAAPELMVMGKRGSGSEQRPLLLGACVDPVIRRIAAPICLAPKLFLPISRMLVLADASMADTRAVDFVARRPALSGLVASLVVIGDAAGGGERKRDWARARLGDPEAEIFTLATGDLDQAVMRYMETRTSDLIVVSRPVLLPDSQVRLRQLEQDSFWGWRTPVIVC